MTPITFVSMVSAHCRGLISQSGPMGPWMAAAATSTSSRAEGRAHARHRGADLVRIAHVRADPQRGAPGVLDLQFGQVQFRLAPRQQPHPGARRRKADRQALADSPARARDQDDLVFCDPHLFSPASLLPIHADRGTRQPLTVSRRIGCGRTWAF